MLKRNGKHAGSDGGQLSLFDFTNNHGNNGTTLLEPIRADGGAALAGVSAGEGRADGGGGAIDGGAGGGSGDDSGRNGNTHSPHGEGAGGGLGVGAGEVYSPADREPERLNGRNYRIGAADALGSGSLKQKARDNFAAIELVHRLDAERRGASDDEKRVLVRSVGWGGIPQVFAENGPAEWAAERAELKRLLSPEEYNLARATTLNAHYTSPSVIAGIYGAVERFGFGGGRGVDAARLARCGAFPS